MRPAGCFGDTKKTKKEKEAPKRQPISLSLAWYEIYRESRPLLDRPSIEAIISSRFADSLSSFVFIFPLASVWSLSGPLILCFQQCPLAPPPSRLHRHGLFVSPSFLDASSLLSASGILGCTVDLSVLTGSSTAPLREGSNRPPLQLQVTSFRESSPLSCVPSVLPMFCRQSQSCDLCWFAPHKLGDLLA